MKFLQYIFLTVVAVLCVFTKQSQGNTLSSLNKSAEIEKIVANEKFQNEQEAIIMASTDKDSLSAKSAIVEIRNQVKKIPAYLASSPAVDIAVEGVIDAARLVYTTIRHANKALDTALSMVKAQDNEAATEVIKKGIDFDKDLIFITGVPIHYAEGAALSIVGGLAGPGLKNAIHSIHKAGAAILEILEIALEIATAGIKEGGLAAEEAIMSARNIISTGLLATYKHLTDANTHALEGIQSALLMATNEDDLVQGIIDSLKTEISTDNSAALNSIAKMSNGYTSVLTNKYAIDAANIMYEGLISTLLETADAIYFVQKTLEEAGKLASQNPEAAIAIVHKGIKAAKNNILRSSRYVFLAFGAAAKIIGKEGGEKLVPFLIEAEYGRVQAHDDMALIERTVIVGIEGGGEAASHGINSGIKMCHTAGIEIYQDFKDAFEGAIKVLQTID